MAKMPSPPASGAPSKTTPRAGVARTPLRLGLPGFISEDTGLGDVVTRAASALGVSACGGCARRAAAMNRWLVFTPGRR